LNAEKVNERNIRRKFKTIHKLLFYKSPLLYNDNAELYDIFSNGNFNYLTASVLFSLELNELKIPSIFLYTMNKSDIIINPNTEQVILETVDRKDENGYFNNYGNTNFIINLLDEKLSIGSEYQYNSSQSSSVVKFKETDIIKSNQLSASIYYYKGCQKIKGQQLDEAYQLVSKAFFLFPHEQYASTMYSILNTEIQQCSFNNIEDVDLLGKLSRFKNNFEYIKNTFKKMLVNKIENQNDCLFCTVIYNRLLPQINDVILADELSYSYYIAAVRTAQSDENRINYAIKALVYKPMDKDALRIVEVFLHNMVKRTENKEKILESLNSFMKSMTNAELVSIANRERLMTYLDIAQLYFMRNMLQEGEKYLTQFETDYQLSEFEQGFKTASSKSDFKLSIENAYYEYVRYFMRIKKITEAKSVVERGLKYAPNSSMIKSATNDIPESKPTTKYLKMTKEQYDKYMKNRLKLKKIS